MGEAGMVMRSDAAAGSLQSSMGVLVIDDDPTILSICRMFLSRRGFSDVMTARSSAEAKRILSSRPFDVIIADYELPPGENSIALLKELKAQGNDTPFIIFTGKSREEVAIEALNSGAAYYLQKGLEIEAQFAELRNMILHLEEKKRARERVLRQDEELKEKNAELESFCYSVSHDLRAPLRVIDGYCGVIQDVGSKDLSPEMRDCLAGIRTASGKMNEMIESLLHFSRAGRLALSCDEVDLSKVAWNITETFRRQSHGRNVFVEIDDGMIVHGDRTLLTMALENILGNAWKYTGKTDPARITFSRKNGGAEMVYSVRDNGAGFDAARAQNLFRPFTRFHTESEFPGTGIGLATAQRIIDRHGGRIWAESSPGQGATFSFMLPDCRGRDGGT